jgi:hypothetical protein
MVASVHTIMNEVPPENILAMVDGGRVWVLSPEKIGSIKVTGG